MADKDRSLITTIFIGTVYLGRALGIVSDCATTKHFLQPQH